ncbi:mCG124752 [Mus musculus]|nr:mCG124752 [Mus musculus]
MMKKERQKVMMTMTKRRRGWKILMKKEMRMKVKKMTMRMNGRKERRMKARMISTED